MQRNKNIILPDWKEISKILKYKKDDFDNLLLNYVNHKKEIYSEVKKIKKENRTFENTILVLENSDDKYSDLINQIDAYSITHKDKAWRDNGNEFQKKMAENIVDIEYDEYIYRSIKEYIEGNYKKEKKNLDTKYGVGSIKLVEDMHREYKRMGFELSKAKQSKLKNNFKNISKLSLDFSKNVDEYSDFILCSEEEIKGLPENFIKTLEKVEGKYKITLEYPSIDPFIKYADNREKKKELLDKNYRKGGEINLKFLAEIVKLRNENAKLLGYRNHVDFNTENRMGKNEKIIRDFIESLIKKLKIKSDKELQELNDFAKNNLEQYKDVSRVEYYDTAYVSNKLKENKYAYDSSKLKEYFELKHVLKTMFSIFGDLFSFTVDEVLEKEKRAILVDKDVRLFEFKDKKTKKILSYLILDLFPRKGKYGHACHTSLVRGRNKLPIDILICNFQKHTKNLPSLLDVHDLEVLFHELGHGLHSMFCSPFVYTTQYGSEGVDHDFVEVPSQMLENFLFEEMNLKKIAINYKTKKPLDKNTIRRLIQSRFFLKGRDYMWLLMQSLYDIDLHSNKIKLDKSGHSLAKSFRDYVYKYTSIKRPDTALNPAGWIHVVGGYDSGYYSYMWALVYAQDFYSEFKKVLDDKNKLKEVGERYRKEILEVGGSREEMVSVKKFLKRNPNNKAFLREVGVK